VLSLRQPIDSIDFVYVARSRNGKTGVCMSDMDLQLQIENDAAICQGILSALISHPSLDIMKPDDIQACLVVIDEKIRSIIGAMEVCIG